MPPVPACALVEAHQLAVDPDVVDREIRVVYERVPAIGAGRPHGLLMVGNIVEGVRSGLHGAGGDAEQGPGARVKRDLESVETAAHVEHFAGGDEMARAELELLPSGAQRDTFVRVG